MWLLTRLHSKLVTSFYRTYFCLLVIILIDISSIGLTPEKPRPRSFSESARELPLLTFDSCLEFSDEVLCAEPPTSRGFNVSPHSHSEPTAAKRFGATTTPKKSGLKHHLASRLSAVGFAILCGFLKNKCPTRYLFFFCVCAFEVLNLGSGFSFASGRTSHVRTFTAAPICHYLRGD